MNEERQLEGNLGEYIDIHIILHLKNNLSSKNILTIVHQNKYRR